MALLDNINSLITTETNKYTWDMPASIDCICLYKTVGNGIIMNQSKESIYREIITLRLRDSDGETGENRIKTIINNLNGLTNTQVLETYFISIILYNNYVCLGRDNNNKWIYECEFSIQIR